MSDLLAQDRALLERLRADEGEFKTCASFKPGGSQIMPDFYCATCGNQRSSHDIREAAEALARRLTDAEQAQRRITAYEALLREARAELRVVGSYHDSTDVNVGLMITARHQRALATRIQQALELLSAAPTGETEAPRHEG